MKLKLNSIDLTPTNPKLEDESKPEPAKLVDLPFCTIPAGGGVESFQMGTTPITNEQYKAVFPEHSYPAAESNYPVVNVSWKDAWGFCEKAAKLLGISMRLPTEFEWCWAAGREPEKLEHYAVFGQEAITQVATRIPNEYGLYDMRGLVWEWLDASDSDENVKVLRGGSWADDNDFARAVFRVSGAPGFRDHDIGFRVVVVRGSTSN